MSACALRVYAVVLFAVVALAGCGSRAEPGHAASAAESWIATARLTGEAWLAGAVPDHYARQVLALSAQRLDEASSKLGSAGDRPRDAARSVARLGDAVRAGQAGAAREALAALSPGRAP